MLQTIHQLLHHLPQNFDKSEAEIIIAHVIDKPREFVIAHPEQNTTSTQQNTINILIKRRQAGIPLAYLTGHKEFFGLDFIVDKHTLIPRPDTEQMVSLVLDEIKRLKDSKIILIDIGTGTGCIPISIINQIRKSELSGYLDCYAIDISANALTVAKKNAKKHNVKIKFLHGDLLSPITKSFNLSIFQSSIIITANLPYLTEEQFQNEPSIQHEPKSALVAKNNGLALYEELLRQTSQVCSMFHVPCSMFFEIDPSQSKSITKLIKQYLPQAKITIHQDLAKLDRIVEIKIN